MNFNRNSKIVWSNISKIFIPISVLLIFGSLVFGLIPVNNLYKGNATMVSNNNYDNIFKEIKKLENEQKYQEAMKKLNKLLDKVHQEKNEPIWTRVLIRSVTLRIALHGYETAVRKLHDEPWPHSEPYNSILHLFYSKTLLTYYFAYSWEINKREKVISSNEVDLKKWTSEQILSVINKEFLKAWQKREALGAIKVNEFPDFINPTNYPRQIRGSLRDFLTYQWVNILGNTSTWKPGQEQDKYMLDFETLSSPPSSRKTLSTEILSDAESHPIEKLIAILDDLFFWHTKSKNKEAALETQLERIRRLSMIFTNSNKIDVLIKKTTSLLKSYRNIPWWTAGRYELAKLFEQKGELVQARKIALQSIELYPKSFGAQRCKYLVKNIEAPDFFFESMKIDRPGERSIKLNHKNMNHIYLRAYSVNFLKWMKIKGNYPGNFNWNKIRDIIFEQAPYKSWNIKLENPADYKMHQTYINTEGFKEDFYVIAASATSDFRKKNNKIDATTILLTPYVISTNFRKNNWEIGVFDGLSGKGVHNAIVQCFHFDYNTGPELLKEFKTDNRGQVLIPHVRNSKWRNIYLIARKGKSFTFNTNYLYYYDGFSQNYSSGVFIFTDRSIYRPLQKLQYKVVAFKGNPNSGNYSVLAKQPIFIQFLDANGKEISKEQLNTNEYGSAAGFFSIPKGRVLGQYRLIARYGNKPGYATVHVEEYKRPTFEVEIKKPDKQLVLNKDATVKGNAEYYFGLPVTSGTVKYRVTREPLFPWWYRWYYAYSSSIKATEIIAGKTSLNEKGDFSIIFTPTADPNLPGKEHVNYLFRLTTEVTDEGGETRTASNILKIGFVAVETTISSAESSFFEKSENVTLHFYRHTLDGVPQAGDAQYRLIKLKQPLKAIPPSAIPKNAIKGQKTILGDTIRPRWEQSISIKKRLFRWLDGKIIKKASLKHNSQGKSSTIFKSLKPGAYRIRYNTLDAFGSKFSTQYEFIIGDEDAILNLPTYLLLKKESVEVGEKATLLFGSGFENQTFTLEFYQSGKLLERRELTSKMREFIINYPILEKHRGGITVRLFTINDFHPYIQTAMINVPWSNKHLKLAFTTFRDKLRPEQKETWTVSVKGPNNEKAAAEILAYMYDRSLDFFTPHNYPLIGSLYPTKFGASTLRTNIAYNRSASMLRYGWYNLPSFPNLKPSDFFHVYGYGIGGPGYRHNRLFAAQRLPMAAERFKSRNEAEVEDKSGVVGGLVEKTTSDELKKSSTKAKELGNNKKSGSRKDAQAEQNISLRSNFNETAFFQPHLITNDEGEVKIKFTVPDSVTSWKVYVHAVSKDLKFMTLQKETVTVKELMVRPYTPRFLRENDKALLNVVINNASDKNISGSIQMSIIDPVTGENRSSDFLLNTSEKHFSAKPMLSDNVSWNLTAPKRIGSYALKVIAKSGELSDGELRPFPVLPSRIHLIQSQFATLKEGEKRVLEINDMKNAGSDSSLINDKLVVTIDTQLIYSVLKALPYLVNYPYECVEQTLNRFLATSMVTSLYDNYPTIKKMANKFSTRKTKLEPWHKNDPNRAMTLEETPWLGVAEGGSNSNNLINVLDERIARAQMKSSMLRLKKAQLANGAFPWWEGGPPSPYITLYTINGLARAMEFKVPVPKEMVRKGWKYLHSYYKDYYEKKMVIKNFGYHFITFLNYVLSCYPDSSYYEGSFTQKERQKMLDYSFQYWKNHNPYLKGLLTLTLHRMHKPQKAKLVLDSIMDSAITKKDQGTFWAPEDRGWLWYNDHIESHAFILRVLQEVKPKDPHIDGLVLWLLLNKKFNQWKSTRTTAEVIYSLVSTLKNQNALAVKEKVAVHVGNQDHTFLFNPDEYTGEHNQIIIESNKIIPKKMFRTVVEKEEGKGFMFASVTWHYSTEKIPSAARGDFLSVTRNYYLRKHQGKEMVLLPLKEGNKIAVGDQIEIHLSIRAKHPMEYVHLRDPRGAGFEPENFTSKYHWEFGIYWYEEIRDSGTNFFFETLPQGEYTFKYRIRATMAGTFRVGPATLQSMYAPEFAAFSSGKLIKITSIQANNK